MSTPELDPTGAAEAAASPEAAPSPPPPPRSGWSLSALIPHDGKQPPGDLPDATAQNAWCAVSALWHPSLLARASGLPRIEPIEDPSGPSPRSIRLAVGGMLDRLPSGYRTQAEDAGAVLLESGPDRDATIREIQEILGAVGTPETSDDPAMIDTARDFLALGLAYWMVRDLSIAMGHHDAIHEEALARETLAGADAWQAGDRPTAVNRLRAAFEVLTQARERSYSVDAYLLDLCLLDPALPAGSLAGPLATRVAITFLAQADAIEAQARQDPERIAALCQAVTDGWVDVAGGSYAEAEDALLPLESTLWQYRRGGDVYREHLEERNVETFARRRFGLSNQTPQIVRRFGFRFAVHFALDGGRFPTRQEPKRLWESPDGSSLESLLRVPMPADRPSRGPMFPWLLAATMRNDHVATVPLVHWPEPVASWYVDLRRAATHSPVFGRWTTLNDYFHLTDRPYETFRPQPDAYATPFLAQSAARREPEPISRLARHHRLRAGVEAVHWTRALALALSSALQGAPADPSEHDPSDDLDAVEARIETGEHAEAATALGTLEPLWAKALAAKIGAAGVGDHPKARPGYLVFNPLGVARRVAVMLPDASADLRPEGGLRAAQLTDEGVAAVVDVPAFGFAWAPRESDPERPAAPLGNVSASGRILKNESIELEVDDESGGVRAIMAIGESTARLGQQVVMTGLGESDGRPIVSRMKRERFEVEFAGPALVQAVATSRLVHPADGRTLARVDLRYRLWTGRPMAEIDATVSDLDPEWTAAAAGADPWKHYLAFRWAWPDANAMLRRLATFAPELTELERPETPDAIDISTRRQRTAMIFGGLPYHQKAGGRMLDTILVAGAETGRRFRVGVVLDLEHPFHAVQDGIAPAPVVATEDGPPAMGDRGWLMHVDHKAIVVTHVGFTPTTFADRGWGLVVHVLESGGHAARGRLRFFRNPTWARQCDFQGEAVVDLSVDGDAVLLDLMPNELARIEVSFG
jgi:alpha-mannosidase